MIAHRIFRSLAVLFLMTLAAPFAGLQAQETESLGTFNAWAAQTYQANNTKVCYIISHPTDSEPKNVRRGSISFFVEHRPGANTRNVVSTIVGYPLREGSWVTVEIGDQSFELFTDGDTAWADTEEKDRQIVAAMRAGLTMVVRGTSQRGTNTVDTYSLLGVMASMERIDQECPQ